MEDAKHPRHTPATSYEFTDVPPLQSLDEYRRLCSSPRRSRRVRLRLRRRRD